MRFETGDARLELALADQRHADFRPPPFPHARLEFVPPLREHRKRQGLRKQPIKNFAARFFQLDLRAAAQKPRQAVFKSHECDGAARQFASAFVADLREMRAAISEMQRQMKIEAGRSRDLAPFTDMGPIRSKTFRDDLAVDLRPHAAPGRLRVEPAVDAQAA